MFELCPIIYLVASFFWLDHDHGDGDGGDDDCNGKYDVVLATEVAYEHRSIDLLLQTIRELLKPRSGWMRKYLYI